VLGYLYFVLNRRKEDMGKNSIKVYPPGGGEPIYALPHTLDYYLEHGWTQEPEAKSQKPKADGKTDRKAK
jgi:hypothetical protein